MNNLLSDRSTYQILKIDPTSLYKKALERIVKEASETNILNNKERSFRIPHSPKIMGIYYLPKIHKSATLQDVL